MSHFKAGLLMFRFSMRVTSRKLRSRRSGSRGTEIEDKGDDFIYEFFIFENSKLIIIYNNLILTNNNFFYQINTFWTSCNCVVDRIFAPYCYLTVFINGF